MKRKKLILSALLLLAACCTLLGQTPKEDISARHELAGNNLLAYPSDLAQTKLTSAPFGYKPFYISTYQRHGSRFLLSPKDYDFVRDILREADAKGVLTELGKETLPKIEDLSATAVQQYGELTSVGAMQHKGVAERMAKNFPEVFRGESFIDARSSVIVRCILSMNSEAMQFRSMYPDLHISCKASQLDMSYILPNNQYFNAIEGSAEVQGFLNEFRKEHIETERFIEGLISDKTCLEPFDELLFVRRFFDLACNMQSHDSDVEFFSLFTDDEIYNLWKCENVKWYVSHSSSPISKSIMPYRTAPLLRQVIEAADSVITAGARGADLRFGHETTLMPFACILELGNSGAIYEDMENLDQVWQAYDIFPMAGNVQLVFYRKGTNGPVLVKALLNEREVTLPVASKTAPYYPWEALRDYYLNKLDNFEKTLQE